MHAFRLPSVTVTAVGRHQNVTAATPFLMPSNATTATEVLRSLRLGSGSISVNSVAKIELRYLGIELRDAVFAIGQVTGDGPSSAQLRVAKTSAVRHGQRRPSDTVRRQ